MNTHRLLQHGYMAITQARYGHFIYNTNDTFIGRSIEYYGEWCEAEIVLLAQAIRPGDVVIDIGANIGTHALPLAAFVGESGLVHAFEPQRSTFQNLCANISFNACRNIVPHHAAVGSQNGTITIPELPPPDRPWNFGNVSLKNETPTSYDVPLVTIDSLDLPSCRLLKIDVEGMEADVIKGAAKTIERCQPILYVENDRSGEIGRATNSAILETGYKAYWHITEYYNPNNFREEKYNVFQPYLSKNLLCLHPSTKLHPFGMVPLAGPDDDADLAVHRIAALAAQGGR